MLAMGLRSWVRGRFAGEGGATTQGPDLLNQPTATISVPDRVGLDWSTPIRPWSLTRLSSIVRDAERHPSELSVLEARHARHCLSSFWLAAPSDHLETLYQGAIGDLQRALLASPLPALGLARDERRWHQELSEQLASADQKPRHWNLLIALMPYAAPGSLTVAEPISSLPDWLLPDYVSHCEPALTSQLVQPAGLLQPADDPLATIGPLAERRGEEAMDWFRDGAALTQMTALINRYGMDASNQEVCEELSGLRSVVAQLWLDVEPNQLKTLYDTPVGLVTRSLISSGFGQELVDADDAQAREDLVAALSDLSRVELHGALLAALLYYPMGAVRVEDPGVLPDWLAQELATLEQVGG